MFSADYITKRDNGFCIQDPLDRAHSLQGGIRRCAFRLQAEERPESPDPLVARHHHSVPRPSISSATVAFANFQSYSSRHLLNDIAGLLPHSRRESKFDSKKNLRDLAEMAELYNCNNASTVRPYSMTTRLTSCTGHVPRMPETPGLIPSLSQSAQRPKSKVSGPEHSYHVSLSCPALWATSLTLLLSREELNFSGNCLKGSRPILSFDAAFDSEPSLRLSRELLTHIFGVPEGARKAKPFVDHVMGFSVLDGKIWVRNYQVKEEDTAEQKDMSLLEIGPRTFSRIPSPTSPGKQQLTYNFAPQVSA